MAYSSPGRSWPPKACHPGGPSVLLQLPLHPAGNLSPSSCLFCLGRNNPKSGDKALSLRPDDAGAEQPPVLTDNYTELPLQFWPPCRAANVFHLAFTAYLDQVVEIFTAIPPGSGDETQQVPKALEPCHKGACLARCCALHLLVQSLQGATISLR